MLSEKTISIIEKGLALLPASKTDTIFDLEVKTSQLLVLCTQIADVRKDLSNLLIAAQAEEKSVYASVFLSGEEKTSDLKRKAHAEKEPGYMQARIKARSLETDLDYLKTILEIFMNGHLFYRQQLKQQQDL